MKQVRKYGFNTEFAANGDVLNDATRRLSNEEIEAENAAAYERGKQDAVAQAEREIAAALQSLAGAASAILTRLNAESRAMRDDAARIAIAAARKIAEAALDGFGQDRAAAAIEAAMDTLRHHPRLVVKLSPEAAETLRPRIEKMSETHAYAGAILIRAEPGLGAGEVIIDWSDGIIATNPKDIAERVESLVESALVAANAAS
jgi:flagellar assembly protein FliH